MRNMPDPTDTRYARSCLSTAKERDYYVMTATRPLTVRLFNEFEPSITVCRAKTRHWGGDLRLR